MISKFSLNTYLISFNYFKRKKSIANNKIMHNLVLGIK